MDTQILKSIYRDISKFDMVCARLGKSGLLAFASRVVHIVLYSKEDLLQHILDDFYFLLKKEKKKGFVKTGDHPRSAPPKIAPIITGGEKGGGGEKAPVADTPVMEKFTSPRTKLPDMVISSEKLPVEESKASDKPDSSPKISSENLVPVLGKSLPPVLKGTFKKPALEYIPRSPPEPVLKIVVPSKPPPPLSKSPPEKKPLPAIAKVKVSERFKSPPRIVGKKKKKTPSPPISKKKHKDNSGSSSPSSSSEKSDSDWEGKWARNKYNRGE